MTKRQLIICLVVESCLLVAFAVTIGILQHSLDFYRIDKDKLELEIRATHHVQGATGADGISVTLRNDNNISVSMDSWEQFSELDITIRSANGVSVPFTERGLMLYTGRGLGSHFQGHFLNPGQTEQWDVSLEQLREYFVLNPGTYTVTASTDVYPKHRNVWQLSIQSNSEPLVIVK